MKALRMLITGTLGAFVIVVLIGSIVSFLTDTYTLADIYSPAILGYIGIASGMCGVAAALTALLMSDDTEPLALLPADDPLSHARDIDRSVVRRWTLRLNAPGELSLMDTDLVEDAIEELIQDGPAVLTGDLIATDNGGRRRVSGFTIDVEGTGEDLEQAEMHVRAALTEAGLDLSDYRHEWVPGEAFDVETPAAEEEAPAESEAEPAAAPAVGPASAGSWKLPAEPSADEEAKTPEARFKPRTDFVGIQAKTIYSAYSQNGWLEVVRDNADRAAGLRLQRPFDDVARPMFEGMMRINPNADEKVYRGLRQAFLELAALNTELDVGAVEAIREEGFRPDIENPGAEGETYWFLDKIEEAPEEPAPPPPPPPEAAPPDADPTEPEETVAEKATPFAPSMSYAESCLDPPIEEREDRRRATDYPEIAAFDTAFAERDLDAAVAASQSGLEKHPDAFQFYTRAANLHDMLGEPEEAEAVLHRGLEHALSVCTICHKLGERCRLMEDYRGAVAWWLRAAAVQLRDQEMVDARPFLDLGHVCEPFELPDHEKWLKGHANKIGGANPIRHDADAVALLFGIVHGLDRADRREARRLITQLKARYG